MKVKSQDQNGSKFEESAANREEGGIFLILVFYYFQDASIVHITPLYVKGDVHVVSVVKQIIGGLFKFQLNVLHFASEICLFKNISPVDKIFLNLLFIPPVFLFLVLVFLLSKLLLHCGSHPKKLWLLVYSQIPVACMLAILFSFQKLALSMFLLIHCVDVYNHSVLFLDGSIQCYTFWQHVIIFVIIFCIIPFALYVCLIPCHMKEGNLTTATFLLGCLFPIPVGIFAAHKGTKVSDVNKPKPTETNILFTLLQGPYKEMYLTIKQRKILVSYSGILLVKRLVLIMIHVGVQNTVSKILLFVMLALVSLTGNLIVKPCKEQRANISVVLSDIALLLITILNLVKGLFIESEYFPTGTMLDVSNVLLRIEDCLLFWIPLAGVGTMLVVVMFRCIFQLFSNK